MVVGIVGVDQQYVGVVGDQYLVDCVVVSEVNFVGDLNKFCYVCEFRSECECGKLGVVGCDYGIWSDCECGEVGCGGLCLWYRSRKNWWLN